ncbi:hypothetical protein E2562_031446 [Oryza meyeriana var. granulata]|uniref:F-box associated beta-propeller type 3 domain-containing protein n=1 Tax=Oryza meyeriana var. granulata TaxID=110450 RepID=A0A6G1BZX0_9ORYZ|nr:hypothetical protein E2562_031446 [Oryza meyeriana var. granulata]
MSRLLLARLASAARHPDPVPSRPPLPTQLPAPAYSALRGHASLPCHTSDRASSGPDAHHPLDAIPRPLIADSTGFCPRSGGGVVPRPGGALRQRGVGLATRAVRSCYRFRTDDDGMVALAVFEEEGDGGGGGGGGGGDGGVIKVGDPQWREIAAERLTAVTDTLSRIDLDRQDISSVALHRKLHWQLRTNSAQWVILVFDMVTEEFRSMVALECTSTWVRGLAALSGRLCSLVMSMSMSLEMWVLDDSHEQQSWQLMRVVAMTAADQLDLANFWESDMRMFLKVDMKQDIEHEVEEIIIHHGNKITSRPIFPFDLRRNAAVYNVRYNNWRKESMCGNGESIMYKESIVPYQMSFGVRKNQKQ